MSEEMNRDAILTVLEGVRADVSRLSPAGERMKSSSWSAHANWKSSSASLAGDFTLESRMVLPVDSAINLEAIARDSGSERFLEVTRSLTESLRQP